MSATVRSTSSRPMPGCRLVEEQQRRVQGEGEGQFQRALLPVRKVSGGPVGEMLESDVTEEFEGPAGEAAHQFVRAPEPAAETGARSGCADVPGRHLRKEAGDLEGAGDAEAGDALRRLPGDVVSGEAIRPPDGLEKSGQQVEQRCFPAPSGPTSAWTVPSGPSGPPR